MDASFVDDSQGDHQGDRLLRVRPRNGGDACVHVVIEHASSVDPYIAFRLLRYRVRIREREIAAPGAKPGRLSQIFTVVVYSGEACWTAPLSNLDMMAASPPLRSQPRDFGYWLRDNGRMRTDWLARHPEFKGVVLTCKHAYRDGVALGVVKRVAELLPEGTTLARQTRRYVLAHFNTDRAKPESARKAKGEATVGELAESWFSRGRAEGRASFRNRQLKRLFGCVPPRNPCWNSSRIGVDRC